MNPNLPDIYGHEKDAVQMGLCQIATEPWDTGGNLYRTLRALEDAARKGAQLAVTPECVLHGCGYSPQPQDFQVRLAAVAVTTDSPAIQEIRALASELAMVVVLGAAEIHDGKLYNSVFTIGASGDPLSIYRKIHCEPYERNGAGSFVPGDSFVVQGFSIDQVPLRMGLAIGGDRVIPEQMRCLRRLGAEFVACPMAGETADIEADLNWVHHERLTQCRAAENQMFAIVVNEAGQYNGGSYAIAPGGEFLLQLDEQPSVEVIALPVGGVRDLLHSDDNGWMGLGHLRPDVYHRYA